MVRVSVAVIMMHRLKWGVENFATDQNMMLHPAIVIAPNVRKK